MNVPKMLPIAVVVGSVVATTIIAAQTVVPRDWRRLNGPPVVGSRESRCSGLADTSWRVEFKDGVLAASGVPDLEFDNERDAIPYALDFDRAIDMPVPLDPTADRPSEASMEWARRYAREVADRHVVRVADGWLIGFDGGEYGGSLWWYPPEPGIGTRLVAENVQAIEPLGGPGNYVVLTGLDHGLNMGGVSWVNNNGGGWGIRARSDIGGRVWAHAPHPDGLVIATRARVSVVSADQRLRHLVSSVRLATPRSLSVSPSGDVAVGRRFFVSLLRLRSNAYEEEWLIPRACRRFTLGDFECQCRG